MEALNWPASVGAFTPQKLAYAINQDFFFVTASLLVYLPVLLCSKLPIYKTVILQRTGLKALPNYFRFMVINTKKT